ncbi:hypothetical protein L6164_000336 [Bauhinia variegata]|uniref:Uncharacterized protein n=1 Tax=Bauhinia variegata TaxID=167791 RepID=A0ACB9Q7N1_BAUVA|nr:hypothetical protein L6164_000336 [Bauhinia variegata]
MKNLLPCIFTTQKAKKMECNTRLADVVIASTAAPFYFGPHRFPADGHQYADGGVAANNPTLVAICEATRMTVNHSTVKPPNYSKFLVLSLGTGSLKRDSAIQGGGILNWMNMVDNYMASIFENEDNFLRIQVGLDLAEAKMDDASKANIDRLQRIAEKHLKKTFSRLNPETGFQTESTTTTYEKEIDKFAEKLIAERRRRNSCL